MGAPESSRRQLGRELLQESRLGDWWSVVLHHRSRDSLGILRGPYLRHHAYCPPRRPPLSRKTVAPSPSSTPITAGTRTPPRTAGPAKNGRTLRPTSTRARSTITPALDWETTTTAATPMGSPGLGVTPPTRRRGGSTATCQSVKLVYLLVTSEEIESKHS